MRYKFYHFIRIPKTKNGGRSGGILIGEKYYKGLVSFSFEEGREFFLNLETHIKYYVWKEGNGPAIEMAFTRPKAKERRDFINNFKFW
ncbi:hypothetical protein OROGR_011315 [Orobanche gracilis]